MNSTAAVPRLQTLTIVVAVALTTAVGTTLLCAGKDSGRQGSVCFSDELHTPPSKIFSARREVEDLQATQLALAARQLALADRLVELNRRMGELRQSHGIELADRLPDDPAPGQDSRSEPQSQTRNSRAY